MKMDITAFTDIYTRYWKKVYAICYHYTSSREDAEEMTQEIFLSVWKRRQKLEFTQSPENYLTKAARYQVLNYYRAKSTKQQFFKNLPVAETDNSTEETILFRELNSSIQQYSSELPQQSGKIFMIRQHTNHTNKEIAETLDISEKAVEYHVSYVKKFLKAKLSYLFSGFL
ncbi:MAG: sigma-70 family RNA polymerase sigma factor [Chitinophagaceae bacterium]|nr:sigma-70 family RNA polymerase sigma factor [Chitinophagaceae bacterium]